jgi:hypothetical protein
VTQARAKLQLLGNSAQGDPKLVELQAVLAQHFASISPARRGQSRAMVFTSMRESVSGICEALNTQPGSVLSARCDPSTCSSPRALEHLAVRSKRCLVLGPSAFHSLLLEFENMQEVCRAGSIKRGWQRGQRDDSKGAEGRA